MGVASRERDRIRSPGRTAGPRAEPSRARCCRSRAGAEQAEQAGHGPWCWELLLNPGDSVLRWAVRE